MPIKIEPSYSELREILEDLHRELAYNRHYELSEKEKQVLADNYFDDVARALAEANIIVGKPVADV